MRIFYLKKTAWPVFIALCIFVGANVILFYKFMSRKTSEVQRAKENLILQNSHRFQPETRPTVKVHADFKDIIKKYGTTNENHDKGKAKKEEDFVTMDMKRKDVNEAQQEIPVPDETAIDTNIQKEHNTDQSSPDTVFGILVIACNRPSVKRCLDQLIKHRPSAEQFPIVVSQDCGHAETAAAIRSYGDQLTHIQQPDLGEVKGVPPNMRHFMGYYKISRHFKWALGQAFDVLNYETVIIVEDDLDIAPDFFEYFSSTRPLLSQDPTLWCVSAWNDNGKEGMVKGNDLLYRTDFFSGLGWMLTKDVWNELRAKWPLGFWDDWMREEAQHKGRACIRPEICRTKTFGKIGVSQGQFFEQHLKFIKLNEDSYPFSKTDLSYLMKDNYDEQFRNKIVRLPTLTIERLRSSSLKEAKVLYSSNKEFENMAKSLGAMNDFKAGIARVSYQGVVVVIYNGCRVYLTPKDFLTKSIK